VCSLLPFGSIWISETCYCNAVTLITDLICALFGPYAAMFVNQIYPWKSLKTSFVSPGKPWNLFLQVLESPGKQYFTVCTNPGWTLMHIDLYLRTITVTINCSYNCICTSIVSTWLPILTILQLPTYPLPTLSLLSEPYQKLFQIHKPKIELLSFSSELLLHQSYNKNGISGSFFFHKSKLHIIYTVSTKKLYP